MSSSPKTVPEKTEPAPASVPGIAESGSGSCCGSSSNPPPLKSLAKTPSQRLLAKLAEKNAAEPASAISATGGVTESGTDSCGSPPIPSSLKSLAKTPSERLNAKLAEENSAPSVAGGTLESGSGGSPPNPPVPLQSTAKTPSQRLLAKLAAHKTEAPPASSPSVAGGTVESASGSSGSSPTAPKPPVPLQSTAKTPSQRLNAKLTGDQRRAYNATSPDVALGKKITEKELAEEAKVEVSATEEPTVCGSSPFGLQSKAEAAEIAGSNASTEPPWYEAKQRGPRSGKRRGKEDLAIVSPDPGNQPPTIHPSNVAPGAYASAPHGSDAIQAEGNDMMLSMTNQVTTDLELQGAAPPVLEATLVPNNDGGGGDEEKHIALATVVETKYICGINVKDRKVQRCICLAVFAFVASIVGLAVGLSKSVGASKDDTDGAKTEQDTFMDMPSMHSTSPTPAPTWSPTSLSWEQIGSDIYYEAHVSYDNSYYYPTAKVSGGKLGQVVSLSSDGKRLGVAFGSNANWCNRRRNLKEKFLRDMTHDGVRKLNHCWSDITIIRVFDLVGSEWSPVHSFELDPYEESEGDFFPGMGDTLIDDGESWATMSGNGQAVAIATPRTVKVVPFPNSTVAPFMASNLFTNFPRNPTDIEEVTPSITNATAKLSISHDGNSLAIGGGGQILLVRNGTENALLHLPNPILYGAGFSGTAELKGGAVVVSADGKTVAFAVTLAPSAPTEFIDVSRWYVRVLSVTDKGDWIQRGLDIELKEAYLYSEESIALSRDGSIVAVGGTERDEQLRGCCSPGCPACEDSSGRVRTWRLDATDGDWVQMGGSILGQDRDLIGSAVSLSSDGLTMVVSGKDSDNGGRDAGVTKIYQFDGRDWFQLGRSLYGTIPGEQSGSSVSLSADGRSVAIGAPRNNFKDEESGAARLFAWTSGKD